MEDLAQQFDFVAALAEMLRQRDPIAPEQCRPSKVDRLGGRRIASQEQRDASRIAYRELAIGPLEADPTARQPVQVGRSGDGIAVAADAAIEIVHGDEQDVRTAGRVCCQCRRHSTAAGQHCTEANDQGVSHGVSPSGQTRTV